MELKMQNIKNLIGDTFRDYQANAVADPDMAKMYADDHSTIQAIARYLETGEQEDINRASQIIDRMDTAPREDIIVACGMDFGPEWVSKNLGWDIA
jgi:division protein CdvB (Snf7/Vps24/ESCRT-III family)